MSGSQAISQNTLEVSRLARHTPAINWAVCKAVCLNGSAKTRRAKQGLQLVMDRFLAALRERLPVAPPQATSTSWCTADKTSTGRNTLDMDTQPSLNAVMLA